MDQLDVDLLRSFLSVAEALQFTAAAKRLGVSQSTISQHVTRLERTVGRVLLQRNTRQVELTADGVMMVDLARDIIAAQDRALSYFEPAVLRGSLRFGVSEDLVLSRLPEVLRAFRVAHPRVDLELVVGLSWQLGARLEAGSLDLLFAKRLRGDTRGITVWHEPLVWLGSPETRLMPADPVPLVLFPGSSITRRAAIDVLARQGRGWHQAFSSDSLSALLAAVRAGFGISAQAQFLADQNTVVLGEETGLPPLPGVDVVVQARATVPDGPAEALMREILNQASRLRPACAGNVTSTRPQPPPDGRT